MKNTQNNFTGGQHWNDYDKRGNIEIEAPDIERWRMSNLHPIEPDLIGQNLAYIAAERLRTVCLPKTTRHLYISMCQQTNMAERNYFGGLERIYQLTRLKRATVTKHLKVLRLTRLVEPQFTTSDLKKYKIRQNYHLFLPPKEILTCSDWEGHSDTLSHKTEYQKFLFELSEATKHGEIGSDEELKDYPYVGPQGEIIHSESDEPGY
jgi:hypothetical protein